MNTVPRVQPVVLAAIQRRDRSILICRRAGESHQGGLWELPGGKVEAVETPMQALVREVEEEVGLAVRTALPLIRLVHHYPSEKEYPGRTLELHTWLVRDFLGTPVLSAGRDWCWAKPESLGNYRFPPANLAIIRAIQLPRLYQITPSVREVGGIGALMKLIRRSLSSGSRLLCLRDPELGRRAYIALTRDIIDLAGEYDARVMLNCPPDWSVGLGAAGLHLNSQRLMNCSTRPVDPESFLAASCHNPEQLQQAKKIGADFVVLSPVKPTQSHPGVETLGWKGFGQYCAAAAMPVYALGGMASGDFLTAIFHGAQGIAAVRSLDQGESSSRLVAYCHTGLVTGVE